MENIYKRISNFPEDYMKEVNTVYNSCSSVENILKWFNKFDLLSRAVENGTGTYRQLENHIFKLKAINIIHKISPDYQILYEPSGLNSDGKNFDLLIKGKQSYLLELKSFQPEDRVTHIPHENITENNEIIMNSHTYPYHATRVHLLDATYHIEEKIRNYDDEYINVMGVLSSFYLHLEDFRNFVAIYQNRTYRLHDPMGRMTLHFMDEEFTGNINEFWGFPFQQTSFSFEDGKTAISVAPVQYGDRDINYDFF